MEKGRNASGDQEWDLFDYPSPAMQTSSPRRTVTIVVALNCTIGNLLVDPSFLSMVTSELHIS